MQVVDYLKVSTPMADAQTQSPEGGAKFENSMAFTSRSERIKTIATWIPASKQLLKHGPDLEGAIRGALAYSVQSEVEDQLLSGNGAGETLHGLITQAASFNTALLPAAVSGWTIIDIIGAAVAQIAAANEVPATFALLHPLDLHALRMTKDGNGNYILGPPNSPGPARVFGCDLISSTAITEGTLLVGSNSPVAAELPEAMAVAVEVSTDHEDFFVKNKVALRAETMLASIVYRPNAFVTGSLVTSPA